MVTRSGLGHRFGRRDLLRAGGTVAAAAVAGAALAGCSSAASGSAAPQPAQTVTTIYFQINWQQSWNKTAQMLVQDFTDQNFNSANKGVRAVPLAWGNASGVLAQVLAGDPSAPAVVSSCCGDFPIAQPTLAALDPFLRQDNLQSSLWSTGQLVTYQLPNGLFGVPAYTACQPLIYDQAVFDDLGLSYPDPSWDHTQATQTWQALVADKGGVHRYGTTMQFYPNNFDGQVFLQKGFGGDLMDASKTTCVLDQAGALAAASWIYPLVWSKVIINRGGTGAANGATALLRGQSVMFQSAGNMLFEAVTVLGNHVKWDVIPMCAWPVQKGTNVNVDYYALNGAYPNQDLAWQLFKFVAAGEPMNRFLIGATLSFPNLTSMWPEWQALVNAAAPLTKDKHLEYWAEAAQQGYGYGREFFLYDGSAALNLMSPILQQMWDQKLDPVAGYAQITQQINALQRTAAAEAGQQAGMAKAFPVTGQSVASVPVGI